MYGVLNLPDGTVLDLDARTVNGEEPDERFRRQIEEERAIRDAIAAHRVRASTTRDTFDLLYAATTAIREWCMDTQAWLYTRGAFGAFDEAGFLQLVQQAETAGLAYNALPPEDLTTALIQEQAGMALRGQQAQILYGLAKGAA